MTPGAFDRQLEIAQERLKTLERLAAEAPDARTVALETLAELSTALEELNVLTEELREQNEELFATQQALEAERRRYLDLFESAPDGYLVTDPDGRIEGANVTAAKLLLLDKSIFVGRSVASFVAEAERATFEAHLTRLKTGAAPPTDWQVLMQPLAGEPVPVSLTVGVTRDETGRLLSLRWLLRDITERRLMEAQLRTSQQELRALTSHLESIRAAERTKIAWEVHDELGQTLAALNFDLQWLAGRLPAEQTILLEKIGNMSRLMRDAIGAARRIFTEMHSTILQDIGLPAALDWQAQEFRTKTGIACQFSSPLQTLELNLERAAVLFRICQEILDDIARHAQATAVKIGLAQDNARLILTVEDNGKGIGDGERTSSIEQVRVREQALALGGTVTIVDRPGSRTTVTVEIPLPLATRVGGGDLRRA